MVVPPLFYRPMKNNCYTCVCVLETLASLEWIKKPIVFFSFSFPSTPSKQTLNVFPLSLSPSPHFLYHLVYRWLGALYSLKEPVALNFHCFLNFFQTCQCSCRHLVWFWPRWCASVYVRVCLWFVPFLSDRSCKIELTSNRPFAFLWFVNLKWTAQLDSQVCVCVGLCACVSAKH